MPIDFLRLTFLDRVRRAELSGAGVFGGTSIPVIPSCTISGLPPTLVAIMGSPAAMYSRLAFEEPSSCEVNTPISLAESILGMSCLEPNHKMCSDRPRCWAWACRLCSGPSSRPTHASHQFFGNLSAIKCRASRRSRCPL